MNWRKRVSITSAEASTTRDMHVRRLRRRIRYLQRQIAETRERLNLLTRGLFAYMLVTNYNGILFWLVQMLLQEEDPEGVTHARALADAIRESANHHNINLPPPLPYQNYTLSEYMSSIIDGNNQGAIMGQYPPSQDTIDNQHDIQEMNTDDDENPEGRVW